MAKKGQWVRIHTVVLKAEQRTAKIPEDTQKCDLEMWTKGELQEDAEIGDTVTVKTAVGRLEEGTLLLKLALIILIAMANLFLRSSRSISS
jgi:hypothetical protein